LRVEMGSNEAAIARVGDVLLPLVPVDLDVERARDDGPRAVGRCVGSLLYSRQVVTRGAHDASPVASVDAVMPRGATHASAAHGVPHAHLRALGPLCAVGRALVLPLDRAHHASPRIAARTASARCRYRPWVTALRSSHARGLRG